MDAEGRFRAGVASAVSAHVMWGLFPLYWKQLDHVPSDHLVFHRLWWSFAILTVLAPLVSRARDGGNESEIARVLRDPRLVVVHGAAAVLIAVNWFAFLWAVNHGAVLQASLGYYINPLFNVLLGVLVLGERLRPVHWGALALAAAGVGVMAVAMGGLPWVSLGLAASFALYGLLKKRTPLGALAGLWLEMALLAPLALVFLYGGFGSESPGLGVSSWTMLVGGGVITIAPLALFAVAAHRVPLSMIGILQYIGPTLQFLVGAVVYREPLDRWRMVGFALVWCGVGLYLHASTRARFSRVAKPVA